MVRIETVEAEKPGLPLIFTYKVDGFLSAPCGLVIFCRRSLLHIGTDFFSLEVNPFLTVLFQPLGIGIFLPVGLGMMRP